jgi:hypothetical protein
MVDQEPRTAETETAPDDGVDAETKRPPSREPAAELDEPDDALLWPL